MKSHGIRKIIASPGNTNITFVGSVMNDPYFQVYSCIDERSAAYMACGMAEESGEPVALSCTGATAARNYPSGLTEAFIESCQCLQLHHHSLLVEKDNYFLNILIAQYNLRISLQ